MARWESLGPDNPAVKIGIVIGSLEKTTVFVEGSIVYIISIISISCFVYFLSMG